MPTLDDLGRINAAINQIPYNALIGPGEAPDVVKDTPDGKSWVCRDYAVRKAIEIQLLGVPQSDYSLVICWTEPVMPVTDQTDRYSGRERHEVLAVHFEGQILIMDSRFTEVGPWDVPPWTGYLWEHQQVPMSEVWRSAQAGLV